MRRETNRSGAERGSVVTQFAVVLPIFVITLVGVFDFGRILWTYHNLGHITRDGARFAAVRSTASEDPVTVEKLTARARTLATGIDPEKVEVQAAWDPVNSVGSNVQVIAAYNFTPLLLSSGIFNIRLQSTASMVISN